MGKHKQTHRRHGRPRQHLEEDYLPSSAFDVPIIPASPSSPSLEFILDHSAADNADCKGLDKYELYQRAVQSPKGDISYLKKFFLTYVGGRDPVHLREDFCGTGLICAEWLKGGAQRFATGLDLDLEALSWGLRNNMEKLGMDACNRIQLFHGNVLHPVSLARIVNTTIRLDFTDSSGQSLRQSEIKENSDVPLYSGNEQKDIQEGKCGEGTQNGRSHSDYSASRSIWPGVDIACAFNYSCCCLSKRSDLISYFKHILKVISEKGGIFAMDLYGGSSSECTLKFCRHFGDFTYIWEQEEFDVINRTTRINLHFRLKNNRMLHHAFTYHWRLWSLPEVRECLEEAGFDSIHIWIRSMPDLQGREEGDDFEENEVKYEEVCSFNQQDAWNAYIVAVRKSCAIQDNLDGAFVPNI